MDAKLLESILDGYPESEREKIRQLVPRGEVGEARAREILYELVNSLGGKEHVTLEDLNERQVEWLEEAAMVLEPALELCLTPHRESSLLRCLSIPEIWRMRADRLRGLLSAGCPLTTMNVQLLSVMGTAVYIAKLAEVARAARTEKASRAKAN